MKDGLHPTEKAQPWIADFVAEKYPLFEQGGKMKRSVLITDAQQALVMCAHALAKQGFQVIASCRKSQDVARLNQEGLTCIQLDLADTASILTAVEQVRDLTGGNYMGFSIMALTASPVRSKIFQQTHLERNLRAISLVGTHSHKPFYRCYSQW